MDQKQKSQPKVVAIIPARYHSNRFEGKPLALIDGKPMIQHVYERARSVEFLSQVVVATDSIEISHCVETFGGNVVMTSRGEFVEVQGTAEGKPFSRESINDLLSLAEKGINQLFQAQQEALKTK